MKKFSKDFIFGTATSSYQIEGAVAVDGRTPSIWDTFSRTPGKVNGGDTGDVACDHYHRMEEDIEILKTLGVDSYRFSIAWPRIFPQQGQYNPEGMAFYKKLVNRLVEENIQPLVTIYHWDMPQWADDQGGWVNRDSVEWFMEFAKKCFEELDASVAKWLTHNEPWCAAMLGYHQGVHAPGHTNLEEALKAAHHILLSHGKAVQYYKDVFGGTKDIGITLNLSPVYAAGENVNDYLAANNFDGYLNRWFLDPLFKGQYPIDMMNLFSKFVHTYDFIQDGDLDIISTPTDFFGINFYNRALMEFSAASEFLFKPAYSDYPKSGMGWDISPNEFKELIHRLRKEYTHLPIYITENGAAFDDVLEADGQVHDKNRVDYVEKHLTAVAELNEEGMNIAGYYLWSLLDNFEWAFGYEKRFGIVYVDFQTQNRYLKDSAKRYAEVIASRSV
ncbi:GH1 family beta-glucosidase [Ectobacillus antri]|jgi:beta-glucosidase|uniref:Beta-glucosidase n=1 Tax=Ectobacillus antri TaxID=2486280 RepID=A0ABT6H8T0_9BACI|nr:GH1 family beta-glucosidase [Ectobacillus antri]MDG4658346.1 GH1 family beta-glucosidase [Ectobacillus antri]MDG5755377.1 GH1 family beta-glucosidase [Ectobacillus antri]